MNNVNDSLIEILRNAKADIVWVQTGTVSPGEAKTLGAAIERIEKVMFAMEGAVATEAKEGLCPTRPFTIMDAAEFRKLKATASPSPVISSEISDNDHKFFVKEEFGRFYLVYEGKTLGTSQCVPPIFADEFQRLLKIEWCVKQQGIDLTAKPKPVSVSLEKCAKVLAARYWHDHNLIKEDQPMDIYVDRTWGDFVQDAKDCLDAAGVKYVD